MGGGAGTHTLPIFVALSKPVKGKPKSAYIRYKIYLATKQRKSIFCVLFGVLCVLFGVLGILVGELSFCLVYLVFGVCSVLFGVHYIFLAYMMYFLA